MIRTFSVLRAIPRDWEIHYVVLHNSGEPMSKNYWGAFREIFPNLTLEEYDRSLVADRNLVEELRAKGKLPRAIALRDRLKRLAIARAVLRVVNLPFDVYCLSQKFLRPHRFVLRRLRSGHFNAVLLDYTKLAYLVPMICGYPVTKILNLHNAESDLARQMAGTYAKGAQRRAAWLDRQVYRFYERHFVPRFDWLLAPTHADAEFHRTRRRDPRVVIFPNCVDTSALRPLPSPEQSASLIFAGRMDYPPNAQAVTIFCKAILPRVAAALRSARLYVVGKNPPRSVRELASEQVIITGYVDDVMPFWRKASVLVVPMSVGGGTRIKILEALALGRAVVSTSKGCEGLEVTHEKEILIADDPDGFARCVVRLCRDSNLYTSLAFAGRELVEKKYSFSSVERLLQDVLGFRR
jgi:glycosyltransferase involved in cell wall biosynthesis